MSANRSLNLASTSRSISLRNKFELFKYRVVGWFVDVTILKTKRFCSLADALERAEGGLHLPQAADLDLVEAAVDEAATLILDLEQLMLGQRLVVLIALVRQRVVHEQLLSQQLHLAVQLLHHPLPNTKERDKNNVNDVYRM